MREKGWLTPLHVAAYNGSLECARLLLFYNTEDGECGTNINASDRGGHTPLHHAVYGGHLDVRTFSFSAYVVLAFLTEPHLLLQNLRWSVCFLQTVPL